MTKRDHPQTDAHPVITILMATFNGARFIDAQIESIAAQTYKNWALWVSDDGSDDETVAKIKAFAAAYPSRDIRIFDGPREGAAQNFLSLLARANQTVEAVAFADQDDVWLPHKLASAAAKLATVDDNQAAGYVCMDIATDENLRPYAGQKRQIRFANFPNALIQNVMRGNAIVLNQVAVAHLRDALFAANGAKKIKFHDWWIYLVLTGLGGQVFVDPVPGLYYRQHGENVLGANVGIAGLRTRLRLLHSRKHQDWITCNLSALTCIAPKLTIENQQILDRFEKTRRKTGFSAFIDFLRSGPRWQSRSGTLIMAIQAFLGRL